MPSESPPTTWRREALWLAVALLPAFLLAPRFVGEMPLSIDHATHLFKSWHFFTELLPSGRLRGWSHYWGFGFPSDELVPCGGELWVALFRALTFGQLSWLRTYALAFAALMILKGYAAFRFGRHFFGIGAGVVAAWLSVLDPGAMLEGGWEWHTTFGVWPVTLAASYVELALVRFDRVLSAGRARDVAAAGFWVGAALLTHQIAIVALALALPLLGIARRLAPDFPRWPAYARGFGALLLGFALASFFVVPFFTHTADTLDLGWLHEPLPVIVERLFSGKTFQNFSPVLHYLGLFGIVLAFRSRKAGGTFFAATALVCVLLASDVLVRTLHLERVLPSLIKLEVNRLLLVAKLFWFPLIGYAAVESVRFLSRGLARAGLGTSAVRVIFVLLGIGVLLVPDVSRYALGLAQQKVIGPADIVDYRDLQRVLEWTRARHEQGGPRYRIAYELWRGNHLPTLAPVFDQTPFYKAGTTPTQIFKNLPRAPGDYQLYAAMSVKYIVAPGLRSDPALRLLKRFGSMFVYEFLGYRAEPFSVLGKGHAELLEFSDERIRLRLRDTAPDTRLKLHVASYSRWRATLSGRELPITTVPVYDFRYPMLMEVPAGDGELVFEYVRRTADWLGFGLSLAAIPGFLLVLWAGRRFRPTVMRVAARVERGLRPAAIAAAALLSVALVGVFVRTRTRAPILPKDSVFQRLNGEELSFAGQRCHKVEPLVFQCGRERVAADVVSEAIWGIHLCMHASRNGVLELDVPVKLRSFIGGSYDAVTREGSGSIRVALDDGELAHFATEPPFLQQQFVQFDTRARRGQTARLGIRLEGTALDCFDFRLLR